MISEETPLVSSPTKHEEVYKRFKLAKKGELNIIRDYFIGIP